MTNPVRIITEKLPLEQCAEGDDVNISYSHNGSWKSIGRGTLRKIKPLPKGGHQIKILAGWGKQTVQKHNIPAHVVVERKRVATEADGPDAGEELKRTAVIGGITYEVIRPAAEIEALTVERQRARQTFPQIDQNPMGVILPGQSLEAVMNYMLASSAVLAGAKLEPRHPIATAESLRLVDEILGGMPSGYLKVAADRLWTENDSMKQD